MILSLCLWRQTCTIWWNNICRYPCLEDAFTSTVRTHLEFRISQGAREVTHDTVLSNVYVLRSIVRITRTVKHLYTELIQQEKILYSVGTFTQWLLIFRRKVNWEEKKGKKKKKKNGNHHITSWKVFWKIQKDKIQGKIWDAEAIRKRKKLKKLQVRIVSVQQYST